MSCSQSRSPQVNEAAGEADGEDDGVGGVEEGVAGMAAAADST